MQRMTLILSVLCAVLVLSTAVMAAELFSGTENEIAVTIAADDLAKLENAENTETFTAAFSINGSSADGSIRRASRTEMQAPAPQGERPEGMGEPPAEGERPDGKNEPPAEGERPEGMGEPPAEGERPDGKNEPPAEGERPEGMGEPPAEGERPEGMGEPPAEGERPEGKNEPPAEGERPEGMGEPPAGGEHPEGMPEMISYIITIDGSDYLLMSAPQAPADAPEKPADVPEMPEQISGTLSLNGVSKGSISIMALAK